MLLRFGTCDYLLNVWCSLISCCLLLCEFVAYFGLFSWLGWLDGDSFVCSKECVGGTLLLFGNVVIDGGGRLLLMLVLTARWVF